MKGNIKISIITGFSILLALYVGSLLGVESLFYASIAAAVVSQSCYREVFVLGIKRLYGTLVGAVVGILFSFYLPHEFIYYAMGVTLIVFICNTLIKAPANMACIVFLAISTNLTDMSSEYYALHRILDTGIGVLSALIVAFIFRQFEKGRDTP